MGKIKKYISLFFLYQRMNFGAFLYYQFDMFAWIIGSILDLAINIFCIRLVLHIADIIGGWQKAGVFILMAFLYLARAFWHTFFINTLDIGSALKNGILDYGLLMPVNPIFHLLNRGRYNTELDWEDILIGLYMLVSGIIGSKINWNVIKVFLLPISLLSGGFIYSGIVFLGSLTAFWTHKSYGIVSIVSAGQDFTIYPITIYGKLLQFVITIIPFAFITYFPVRYIVYNEGLLFAILSPFIAIIIWKIISFIWKLGLKAYQGYGN